MKENITIAFKSGNRLEIGEKTLKQPCEKAFMDMLKDRIEGSKRCRYGLLFITDWQDVDFILLTEETNMGRA